MAKSRNRDSTAVRFLRVAWESQRDHRPFSWPRFISAERGALVTAIEGGFEFHRDDFVLMAKDSHNEGLSLTPDEPLYALAVKSRFGPNPSACQAFEHWKGRKPFLIRHSPDDKSPKRVAVGTGFEWYGMRVRCTSFGDDDKHLIACCYKQTDPEDCPKCRNAITYAGEKLYRRHSITHDDIKTYHTSIKRTEAVKERIGNLTDRQRDDFDPWHKGRGIKSRSVLYPVDLDAIEEWLDDELKAGRIERSVEGLSRPGVE